MKTVYMVFWDDDGEFLFPMGHDGSCPGALRVDKNNPIAFESKKQAQRAIRVSRDWYRLQTSRGDRIIYDDFDPCYARYIKIVPVRFDEEGSE